MKKKIAEWLRNAADKLTGEQTIDIAIAKEFEFVKNPSELSIRQEFNKEREWVRKCIIEGVRKASFEGIFRWKESSTETIGTTEARLRIISPIVVKKKQNKNENSH